MKFLHPCSFLRFNCYLLTFAICFISGLSVHAQTFVTNDGQYEISIDTTGFATIEDYLGTDVSVVIPNIVFTGPSALVVRVIGFSSFAFSSLEFVSIPASVEEIEAFAFRGNSALSTIELSEGVKTIGPHAFASTGLESIVIPSTVESLSSTAFRRTPLRGITVAENPDISANFFATDDALFSADGTEFVYFLRRDDSTPYRIPDGVEVIQHSAFYRADNLSGIEFPHSLKRVESDAFREADSIEAVDLPVGVTDIGIYAFYDIDQLTDVVIRGNIQNIGEGAFGKPRPENGSTQQPLDRVLFFSDAPDISIYMDDDPVFENMNPTVFFYSDAAGFTTPTWEGLPSVELQVETVPGFGEIRPVPHQENVFFNERFGRLDFGLNLSNRTAAFSEGLQTELIAFSDSFVASAEYGQVTPGGDEGWLYSELFGWTHFGEDFSQYGGWVSTERFGWMKFEQAGGETYLWANHLQTWLSVNQNGSFFSFDIGLMVPITGTLNRYGTRIGRVTADQTLPAGWLASDVFGFVWFARDGTATWFWSDNRQEWIGITPEGGLWSTAEGQFLN